MDKTSEKYRIAELERLVSNLIRVFTISELDEEKRLIRLVADENETDWLPWPASTGRNFTNWRPLKKGQQMIIASVGGDLSQGLVIGEIYSNEVFPPSDDKDIDSIKFSNGNYFERNAKTGRTKLTVSDGIELRGGSSTVIIDNDGVRLNGKEIHLN